MYVYAANGVDMGGQLPAGRRPRRRADPAVVGERHDRALHRALVVIEQLGKGADADRLMLGDFFERQKHARRALAALDRHYATPLGSYH